MNIFGKHINLSRPDNKLIKAFVKNIYLYNDKKAEVKWNFEDTIKICLMSQSAEFSILKLTILSIYVIISVLITLCGQC